MFVLLDFDDIIFNRYEAFTGRSILAALDHNFHLFRAEKERFHKLYSKRSGNWRVEPVKVPKKYDYLESLICEILQKRVDDPHSIGRHISIAPTNPVNLAQNIAMREPPSTSDLIETRTVRKKVKLTKKCNVSQCELIE